MSPSAPRAMFWANLGCLKGNHIPLTNLKVLNLGKSTYHIFSQLIQSSHFNRATLLEISYGFQSVDGCWVCIDWTKLPLELVSEVFPIDEFMVANIFRLLLPLEYAGGPLSCSSCLHVWHGPDNFGLFVCEGVWTEMDIDRAGIKERHSFGVVSIELQQKGQHQENGQLP